MDSCDEADKAGALASSEPASSPPVPSPRRAKQRKLAEVMADHPPTLEVAAERAGWHGPDTVSRALAKSNNVKQDYREIVRERDVRARSTADRFLRQIDRAAEEIEKAEDLDVRDRVQLSGLGIAATAKHSEAYPVEEPLVGIDHEQAALLRYVLACLRAAARGAEIGRRGLDAIRARLAEVEALLTRLGESVPREPGPAIPRVPYPDASRPSPVVAGKRQNVPLGGAGE